MRHRLLITGVLVLTSVAAAPALEPTTAVGAVDLVDLSADVIMSENVNYHGTIPLDSPGVGGEVVHREDLDKTLFYVTGLKGLTIYDISIPYAPVLAGHLPFAHAQNEDVRTSADGRYVIIAADGSLAVPVNPVTVGITVIDVTNPALPTIVASNNDRVMGRGTASGIAEHTAECAVEDCSVIYGRTGRIYAVDLEAGTVEEQPRRWNQFLDPVTGEPRQTSQIHALDRDDTGLVIADSTPRLVLDPLGLFEPASTPTNPAIISVGERPAEDNRLQHNNRRPNALDWQPRDPESPADAVEFVDVEERERSISIIDQRPVMRPGELLIGNSESNVNPACSNAGGLTTWSMVNFDQHQAMQPLEVFRPLNGTWLEGSAPANALGCSGHWFTVDDGIVAASWYEHGVHFFEVDEQIGTIDEVGYFQPVVTEAGASYWVDGEYVYNVDYARGIDIVSFEREAPTPSQAELDAAWIANLGTVGQYAAAERYWCRLAASG